jgi:hypothetical protein
MGRQRGDQPSHRQEAVDLLGDGVKLYQERATALAGSLEGGLLWPDSAYVEFVRDGHLPAGSTVEDVDGLLEWPGKGPERARGRGFRASRLLISTSYCWLFRGRTRAS